ncbi:hypothetical protein GF389_02755 [Candidatus Dojkabacteria bacterium]|nr:hypothetical protein [Candidatus Dojkabacteria bacterium]
MANVFGGIILITIGISLLVGFGSFWALILFIIGLYLLIKRKPIAGFILLFVGIFFILSDLLDAEIEQYFFPLIIIGVGLLLMLRSFGLLKTPVSKHHEGDKLDDFAFFYGNERKIKSDKFKKASLVSIFGANMLDFRDAKTSDGKIMVEVFALFGGCEVIVPKGWKITSSVLPILAGFEDKTTHESSESDSEKDKSVEVEIEGVAIFGGVEVKN